LTDFGAAELDTLLHKDNNWGRWGADDEVGAVNLITAQKRVAAAALVRSGRSVSLSLDFPTQPAPGNGRPAHHYLRTDGREHGGGVALDYVGVEYHGHACTHVDALCHAWDDNGMWNGRSAEDVLGLDGARWGTIDRWRDGITTRGVLVDVPAFRGTDHVEPGAPVTADELDAIVAAQGVAVEPGDALVVYSGRDRWEAAHGPWGGGADGDGRPSRPGLDASCVRFLKERDVSVLAWDMMDAFPHGYEVPWTVHSAIFALGVALVDNCALGPLAQACREEGRQEFMFVVAPLVIPGGTGSPANPLALF
jgi:kynurenine formamidase